MPEPHIPKFDLNTLPDQYALLLQGTGLEPKFTDGTALLFDKTQPVRPGDFAVIYRRPELVKPGQFQGQLKRIVIGPPQGELLPCDHREGSTVAAAIIAEQLNPRRQYVVPCTALLAIHRCVGPVPAGTRLEPTAAFASRRARSPVGAERHADAERGGGQ